MSNISKKKYNIYKLLLGQYNNKYIAILILVLIYRIDFSLSLNNNSKTIFTFWEPKENIPGYLSLCIKTWKKYLPDYKVIILNYQKVRDYLGDNLFSSIICMNMSVMVQADAIRVAVLNKFGGIWMDADNIIINGEFIKKFKTAELGMIMDKFSNFPFIFFNHS